MNEEQNEQQPEPKALEESKHYFLNRPEVQSIDPANQPRGQGIDVPPIETPGPIQPTGPDPEKPLPPVKVPKVKKEKKEKKPKKLTKGEELMNAAQNVIDAVDELNGKLDEWESEYASLQEAIDNALGELRDVRENNYGDWHSNLPENLQGSALGEKLQTLMEIDLDIQVPDFDRPDLDEAQGAAEQIQQADLPLGFGRD